MRYQYTHGMPYRAFAPTVSTGPVSVDGFGEGDVADAAGVVAVLPDEEAPDDNRAGGTAVTVVPSTIFT